MTSEIGSAVIPCLTYRDAPRMITWLCDAFGFQRHAVYGNDAGRYQPAELVVGQRHDHAGLRATGKCLWRPAINSGQS